MLICLMRHGIAQDRDDPESPPDPDRQLTRKGAERARQVARGLRALGVRPGAVLTSPYLRAVQTAAVAARGLGVDEEQLVQTEALLPDGDPAQVFAELLEVEAEEVLLVGHAPNLDEVLAFALGGGRAPFTRLKKAGAACVAVDSLAAPRGQLEWLLEPRVLRRLGAG
ncbi:MAG: phosphohistidine phosphatase SixA [Deltaproteobacteria bacterium]|nr:phosphohistidine phosphatase SixA [Deltaproteobacteria bacterium]